MLDVYRTTSDKPVGKVLKSYSQYEQLALPNWFEPGILIERKPNAANSKPTSKRDS